MEGAEGPTEKGFGHGRGVLEKGLIAPRAEKPRDLAAVPPEKLCDCVLRKPQTEGELAGQVSAEGGDAGAPSGATKGLGGDAAEGALSKEFLRGDGESFAGTGS